MRLVFERWAEGQILKERARHFRTRTIANVSGLNDFELFLDIWVEQTVEVKPIWTFFPASEIRNFVSMDDVAFST